MATIDIIKDFVNRGRKFQREAEAIIKKAELKEHQRHAGKARMRKLTKKQRQQLGRKGGLASAKQREKRTA